MSDLTNRVVLLTGASGGLGGAVTTAFLEAGATVVGTGRSAPVIATPNARFHGIAADLSTGEGASTAIERAIGKTGRIDALMHLVGGFSGGKPVAETDDATWNDMLNVNLHAAFHTARAVLPHMIAAGRGRIVAIGSRTGVEPVAALSAYGVAKAGLIALVRTIALEVKNAGVTANVVLPSVIDTPANRAANPGADYSNWVSPQSIARLLVWLTSDEAGDMNGAVIPIYGRA
jgi:NAD(P)-dependent dehydrogenase (short-subunit alcohol dehydrogenase family)